MAPTLRVVGINAGFILAVFLAAELVFGNWLFGPSFGALNLPRDIERRFVLGDRDETEWTAVYTRDRWGLRGRYDGPATIGILALGGSTTNELYVTDGETWTDRLAQKFAADGTTLSVVNAGAEGQSTVGHLRNFEAWFPLIPGLKPRYVLAYIGVNDMALGHDGIETEARSYDQAQHPRWDRRLRRAIRNNSALYRLWRMAHGAEKARAARLVHARAEHVAAKWTEHPVPVDSPEPGSDLARRLEGYRTRVAELIRRSRALGAEAIIVTQQRSNWRRENGKIFFVSGPDGAPVTADYAETVLFNRAAMATCREAKALCVDLGGEIEFKPGDFYDWAHTTPAGSARIADHLFAALKDRVR